MHRNRFTREGTARLLQRGEELLQEAAAQAQNNLHHQLERCMTVEDISSMVVMRHSIQSDGSLGEPLRNALAAEVTRKASDLYRAHLQDALQRVDRTSFLARLKEANGVAAQLGFAEFEANLEVNMLPIVLRLRWRALLWWTLILVGCLGLSSRAGIALLKKVRYAPPLSKCAASNSRLSPARRRNATCKLIL